MTEHANVVLAGNGGRTVNPDRVFFAFPSGRFAYDCVTCGAQCCKGHGFLASQNVELKRQLEMSPTIAAFVKRDRGANTFMVLNHPPACFFLEADKGCRVHREHGYTEKPETCRLFPFNNFRYVNGYLIVMPHLSLCPLDVVKSGGAPRAESDYDALLTALSQSPITGTIVETTYRSDSLEELIAGERRVVSLTNAHAGATEYWTFAAAQCEATGGSAISLESHREMLLRCLGPLSATTGEWRQIAEVLIAATPTIRSEVLFGSGSAPPHLRVPRALLPHFLTGLYVLLVMANKAGAPVTFQTVTSLLRHERLLLTLLCRGSEVLQWRGKNRLASPAGATKQQLVLLVKAAKALLPDASDAAPRNLGAILAALLDGMNDVDRFATLRLLAEPILKECIGEDDPISWRESWRHRVRRVAWTHLDTALLVRGMERERAKVPPVATPRNH